MDDNKNKTNKLTKQPVKISSIQDIQYSRALMRSGELSEAEYREYGSAIQDLIDDARD